MTNRTIHGGRLPRILDESGEAWYHVYNRIACDKDKMPLHETPKARETFVNYLNFYTSAYLCDVATYTIMGNHYHLILKMHVFKELSREELYKRKKNPKAIRDKLEWFSFREQRRAY